MAIKSEEVNAAKADFDKHLPRHGVLMTARNNLYVGIHAALREGKVTTAHLNALGQSLIKALAERPRGELTKTIATAEAIHDSHGVRAALSYLHGELKTPSIPAPPGGQPPVLGGQMPLKMVRALLKASRAKPSVQLAAVERILKASGVKLEKKADRHWHTMLTAETLMTHAAHMTQTHRVISENTGIKEGEVRKRLLSIYDRSTTDNGCYMPSAFETLAKQSITNRAEFEQITDAFEKAVKTVEAKHNERKKSIFAFNTYVFSDILSKIEREAGWEKNKLSVDKIKEIIRTAVEEYVKPRSWEERLSIPSPPFPSPPRTPPPPLPKKGK